MSRAEFSYDFPHRSLLSVADLNPVDIQLIFERAAHWRQHNATLGATSDALAGLTVLNLFFEPSTRTQGSFEMAGKRLGADVVNFAMAQSSASKGESLTDTARTLAAMRPDIMIVRHSATGAPASTWAWASGENSTRSTASAGATSLEGVTVSGG